MTKRTLPALKNFQRPGSMESPAPVKAFDRWSGGMAFNAAANGTVIDILDVIGTDTWTGEGINTAYVIDRLRGAGDVTVNINSPGGDYFEGAAIYELLRGHSGAVTVNILGIAASAASIIAMAGDEIRIGQTGFIMIHNCWGVCIGDRHDMTAVATTQEQIDLAIGSVYVDRTKQSDADIAQMMDDETWLAGKTAVEKGFADALLPPGAVGSNAQAAQKQQPIMAQRRMDSILAHQGVTRAERRRMFNEIKRGTHNAAVAEGTQDAADISVLADELRALHATFQ